MPSSTFHSDLPYSRKLATVVFKPEVFPDLAEEYFDWDEVVDPSNQETVRYLANQKQRGLSFWEFEAKFRAQIAHILLLLSQLCVDRFSLKFNARDRTSHPLADPFSMGHEQVEMEDCAMIAWLPRTLGLW